MSQTCGGTLSQENHFAFYVTNTVNLGMRIGFLGTCVLVATLASAWK